jgi:hypothetical protein
VEQAGARELLLVPVIEEEEEEGKSEDGMPGLEWVDGIRGLDEEGKEEEKDEDEDFADSISKRKKSGVYLNSRGSTGAYKGTMSGPSRWSARTHTPLYSLLWLAAQPRKCMCSLSRCA